MPFAVNSLFGLFLVLEKLQELLNESALADIEIHINNINNANLIGTGIAALS